MRVVALITVAMLVVTPCNAYRRKNTGTQHSGVEMTGPDWYGDATTNLVRLDQGWFVTEPSEGDFLVRHDAKGNTNVGHEFGAHLSEAERWQVVEYLKSL